LQNIPFHPANFSSMELLAANLPMAWSAAGDSLFPRQG